MPRKAKPTDRRICYVTGTRAEFGLMVSTLRAIQSTPGVRLQIVATGMHLNAEHGRSLDRIIGEGWKVDAVVPWPAASNPDDLAEHTATAGAGLATAFKKLRPDVVLVVGDRVEAFAAASVAHVAGRVVAHIHGGDRALGQIDDSLRHAITKLSHLHFPATAQSASRLRRLGEDRWRIYRSGSPGIDGIRSAAAAVQVITERYKVAPKRFALVSLHPTEAADSRETVKADLLLKTLRECGVDAMVVIGPNNDPGSRGIRRAWKRAGGAVRFHADVPRGDFLGLLRDAAFLIGNSSSGIIEAASFRTPVIDVGERQQGRERSENVWNVPFREEPIRRAISRIWRGGLPRKIACRNVYGAGSAGKRIALVLATVALDEILRRKLISY